VASNSNIIQLNKNTVKDICQSIADRVKSRRLEMNLTQNGLSARSGVNIETYRKFERKGEISIQNLVKIAFVMDVTSDFDTIFAQKQYESLDDLLGKGNKNRKRGKRK